MTRIAAVGDTGTGDDAHLATVQEMVDQTRDGEPYEALVLLGDLVHEEGDAELVDDRSRNPSRRWSRTAPSLVPVLGNHDYESDEQDEILAALGRDCSWYVERIDRCASSPWTPNASTTRNSSRVARGHARGATAADVDRRRHAPTGDPPASTAPTSRSRSTGCRFEEYDVPLVLAGHDHDYQRLGADRRRGLRRLRRRRQLRPAGEEDFTAVSTSTLHYLEPVFHEKHIVGRAIDQSGEVIDAFAIGR